jgi:hypothetical protein
LTLRHLQNLKTEYKPGVASAVCCIVLKLYAET